MLNSKRLSLQTVTGEHKTETAGDLRQGARNPLTLGDGTRAPDLWGRWLPRGETDDKTTSPGHQEPKRR